MCASVKWRRSAGNAGAPCVLNKTPLKGVGRDGTEYPKHFYVKVPVLKGDGSLRRDEKVKLVFKTEYGVLSCYIIGQLLYNIHKE